MSTDQDQAIKMPEHKEVVVIGAGQAGLATGYYLARQGRDFTILDAAAEPAAAWRSRWDSLRLFTPAGYDSLPGRKFPNAPDSYPSRDDVISYLTDYARDLDLPVELNSSVRSVHRAGSGYTVAFANRTYEADQVVIATGPFQTPRVPVDIAEGLDTDVVQMHSSDYRRPEDLPAGRVLVVGGGNSGYQIAEDLAAGGDREVHLAVGSRQTPLPTDAFGRELFSILSATGLMDASVDSRKGRWFKSRNTLVGSSNRRAKRNGISLRGRALSGAGSAVGFADGTTLTVDAIVWATGFAVDYSWIDVPVFDAAGQVVHSRGVTSSPGLYFVGLPWQHSRGSALLGWVQHDAEHVTTHLASTAPWLRLTAHASHPTAPLRKATSP